MGLVKRLWLFCNLLMASFSASDIYSPEMEHMSVCELFKESSIQKLVGGIQAILVKVCTVCAHYCQFLQLNCTKQGNHSNPMQIALNILAKGIKQMYITNIPILPEAFLTFASESSKGVPIFISASAISAYRHFFFQYRHIGYRQTFLVPILPNSTAVSYCNADYSVRHLNENNETTKLVQTLKSPPPLREGPK